jgi:enoyl-CoA hydratase
MPDQSDPYIHIAVEKANQVATIRIRRIRTTAAPFHWELGEALSALRGDDEVRVIVLTGEEDGVFSVGPRSEVYASDEGKRKRNDPVRTWKTFTGLVRCHEVMAAIEKPIVARVNGDAIAFGSSLLFASDLIVAREDARVVDYHLAMGELPWGPPYGIVPGDGGAALVPLYMSPPKAKEYLMLAKEYSGADLARMGLINYAVPAEKLDEVVDDLVRRLLERSAYALAWTKRVVNRRIVDQLNMTLDAGAAYEMVTLHQIERLGWEDPKSLG